MQEIVCRKCHYSGEQRLDNRGSTTLEVILWLCLILPGYLYSRWRDRSLRPVCPECGSPVTTLVDAMPDLAFVKAGTLDDTRTLKPTMEIFCSSAQSWTRQTEGQRQRFDKGPG